MRHKSCARTSVVLPLLHSLAPYRKRPQATDKCRAVRLGTLFAVGIGQFQNLMYCQLYDLPAGGNKKGRLRDPRYTLLSPARFVNPRNDVQS